MRRIRLLAAAAGLGLALAACGPVSVPGLNPRDEAPRRPPPPPGWDEGTFWDEEPAAQDAATAPVEMAAAETGEPDPEETDAEAPEPGPHDRDGAVPPDAAAATLMVPSLAELNAMRCILPEDAAPTRTAAMMAGATAIEEPVMGPEAVGALAASLESFPGIVKLEPRRAVDEVTLTGHCGAARIARNWLVTAAHCVDQPFDEIRLIGEAADLRSPEARIATATTALCHGGYGGAEAGYANDIALVRLDDAAAEALGNVPVAPLGATRRPLAPANYGTAEMAGWGVTRFGGGLSGTLLAAPLTLVSAGPATLTLASLDGSGPCVGDSGGPLFVTEEDGSRTLVGLLSVVEQSRQTGEFCSGEYRGRYINLQGYQGWIESVMALCDAAPEACL
jgi:hypothetical protein